MGLQRSLVLIAATAVSLLAQSSTECDCLDGGCAPVPSCVSTTQCILDCASDALTSTTCATSDLASFLSCRLLEDDAKIVACVSAAVDNANAECGVCITGVIQDIEDIQDETLNDGFLAGQLPCIKPTNFEGCSSFNDALPVFADCQTGTDEENEKCFLGNVGNLTNTGCVETAHLLKLKTPGTN
ncbi:hypothetical protein ScalyP_jg9576 [Parmales sp. scaly parma]|nr:hypothetical protein ScalyP_jg9576 [Parmales sp. scaly parma]